MGADAARIPNQYIFLLDSRQATTLHADDESASVYELPELVDTSRVGFVHDQSAAAASVPEHAGAALVTASPAAPAGKDCADTDTRDPTAAATDTVTSFLNIGPPLLTSTLTLRHKEVNEPVRGYGGRMGAMEGIVDSHVHLLPGRIGEKVRAIFETGETAGRFTLAYPSAHDRVVAQLRAEGVGAVWSLPYAHKAGVAEGLNEASAATAARFTDDTFRVTGGATVHPDDADPAGIVHRAVGVHSLRVLKLHCSVGDFGIDDPRLTPALGAAEQHRMPTVVHLGHNPNGLTEGHELDGLRTVCARHPGLPVVLAHFGHHSAPEAVELFGEFTNFHADLTPVVTSAPNVTAGMLARWSDRILFGSDAPNTAVSVTDHLAWLGSFGLDDGMLTAITSGNARRLVDSVVA